MGSIELSELIDRTYLQQMMDHSWSLSRIPSRIVLPPREGASVTFVQAPAEENGAGPADAYRWEENNQPFEGEICLNGQRMYLFPIRIGESWVANLILGGYSLPGDPPPADPRNPSLTQDKRDRAVESQRTFVSFVTAVAERNLFNIKAERALQEYERRYRGIFDSVQDGIIVETLDGRVIDANPAAAAMHGYTREEMLALTVQDLAAPGRPIHYLGPENPPPMPLETWNRRKDGSIFPVELIGRGIELENAPYLLVVVRDITARKQAEEVARQSQERLELALEATEAGFWDWDIPSGYDYLSPRWFSMLGYRPNEFPPSVETWRSLIHPQDAVRTNYIFEQHLAGKRPFYEAEFRMKAKDGSWRWILSRGKITRRDAEGKPVRMTGTHIDITLRKQSEAALRSSEEKFYKAFQISPDAISINRASDTVYLDVNHVFTQLTGYAREEIIGRTSFDLGVWAYPDERQEMVRILHEKGEVLGMEATFRRRDGQTVIGLLAARQIEIDGAPCVLTIVRDITDRKLADDLLRDAHIRLKWAYEATLLGWNKALEMRDVATKRHSESCTELTLRLALAAGISDDEELTFIKYGAILHDIGKLAIPDMILNKPTPLNAEEWNILRRHPLYAQEMLTGIDYLHPVLPLVTNHHERWDGNGYPLGLSREQIPLEARIFAIVDVWDSMTTARPYRPALSRDTARAYINENAGFHFDPELVRLFLKLID